MLMVRTRLHEFAPGDIGLVALEDIPEGAITWQFHPAFDKLLCQADINELPQPLRDETLLYAYLDPRLKNYVVCGDNAKFMRHSENPNNAGRYKVVRGLADFGISVATRLIRAGDELTSDWREFDAEWEKKLKSRAMGLNGLCARM
jgi:SET domain-containing protein